MCSKSILELKLTYSPPKSSFYEIIENSNLGHIQPFKRENDDFERGLFQAMK